jgi:asparagine synthetase B (glutamine-hydrolysing)
MIFDFVLIKRLEGNFQNNHPKIENAFKKLSIYNKSKFEKFSRKSKTLSIDLLTRWDSNQSMFISNDWSIFIIGECFSRIDSVFFKGIQKKLNANDIYFLYLTRKLDLVNEIKGNFQIIIIQNDDNKIIVINSKSGVSPFYYYFDSEIFVCSTAIYLFPDFLKDKLKFSYSNILEYALFNYPLGENTLFENVYNLLPGEIVTYNNGKLEKATYYNVTDFITDKRISKKEAIENGVELFNKIVNSYVADKEKINVSLTGGFDGRAILSALKFDMKNVLLYSFGIKGSKNISIPQQIAKDLNYNFKPYFLEEEYSEAFPLYGTMTCLLTDCLATFQRANYLYVFEDLSKHSDVVLTGIFGSELMRTFQNAGLMISESAVKILLAIDSLKELDKVINNYTYRLYWGDLIFNNENKEKVIESWRVKYLNRKYEFKNQYIFTYFIKDALRKYFGGEVHSERIFATNRFPFFDDEFVELILKSPFSAINNTFMKPTINERLNSQLYYAYILKYNKPELLNYTTDHGFAPKYLLYPFSILFIGPQVFIKSKIRKWKKYKEFNTEEWAERLFDINKKTLDKEFLLNTKLIKKKIESREWKIEPEEFKKLFSIQLYTNHVSLI